MGRNIDNPFATAVNEGTTVRLRLGHIPLAIIVDGCITLLERSLGSGNDAFSCTIFSYPDYI